MPTQRTTVEIHTGLTAEVTWDADAHIGEAVIAGQPYGFAWAQDGLGVQWDRNMPYVGMTARISEIVGL